MKVQIAFLLLSSAEDLWPESRQLTSYTQLRWAVGCAFIHAVGQILSKCSRKPLESESPLLSLFYTTKSGCLLFNLPFCLFPQLITFPLLLFKKTKCFRTNNYFFVTLLGLYTEGLNVLELALYGLRFGEHECYYSIFENQNAKWSSEHDYTVPSKETAYGRLATTKITSG